MDDYIWLMERAGRREAAWAMTGSLLTHALMLFVLTCTDVSIPLTGMAGERPGIIWISPLALTDQPLEHPGPAKVARRTGPGPAAEEREAAGRVTEVAEVAAISMPRHAAPPVSSSMAVLGPKEAGEELQASPTAGPAGAAHAKEPGANDQEGVSRESDVRERVSPLEQGAYMAAVMRGSADADSLVQKESLVDATLLKRTAGPRDDLHEVSLSGKSGVATDGGGSRAVSVQKELPKPPPVPPLPLEVPAQGGVTAAALRKHESFPSVAPETAEAESSKKPAAAGIVYPSVIGDLKLVIERSSGGSLLVTFRELPGSRRTAPQMRVQSGVQKQVFPIYSKTKGGAVEAVIMTVQEGVYTFRIEDVAPGASVTLRLFEGSAKEKVAPLRLESVSNRQLLVKVLMPEGILWNDDAAFTGSLEDSNGTTKFNTQSGLYWREYND